MELCNMNIKRIKKSHLISIVHNKKINFHNKKLNDFLLAWGVIRGKRARGLISDEEYLNWKYQIQI